MDVRVRKPMDARGTDAHLQRFDDQTQTEPATDQVHASICFVPLICLIRSYFVFSEQTRCAAPEQMTTHTLNDLWTRKSTMRCFDTSGNHPERDGSVLIGILAGNRR